MRLSRGRSRETFLRLCSRAPRTMSRCPPPCACTSARAAACSSSLVPVVVWLTCLGYGRAPTRPSGCVAPVAKGARHVPRQGHGRRSGGRARADRAHHHQDRARSDGQQRLPPAVPQHRRGPAHRRPRHGRGPARPDRPGPGGRGGDHPPARRPHHRARGPGGGDRGARPGAPADADLLPVPVARHLAHGDEVRVGDACCGSSTCAGTPPAPSPWPTTTRPGTCTCSPGTPCSPAAWGTPGATRRVRGAAGGRACARVRRVRRRDLGLPRPRRRHRAGPERPHLPAWRERGW